ncbi:riboflavin synthase [Bacteroidetes/Chlorobi group bacterium ChocPot_Mid]|nr:MAG: riboflavin synthase [Bacteroidetes/Chlorobi group bacterium ChocPot_Mid]
MFTGLIEEIGEIKAIRPIGNGRRFTIGARKIMNDLKIDDSVALNGVCQTVVKLSEDTFEVEAVEETLRKTTLGKLNISQKINLERAVRLNDRLGGHLVQGHVDCTGYVLSIIPESAGKNLWVSFPTKFRKYVVPVGSICIDGVSLTVAKVEADKLMVAIIPHTWNSTIFKELKNGKEVNLEFDIIGKYIENMTNPHFSQNSGINFDYLP